MTGKKILAQKLGHTSLSMPMITSQLIKKNFGRIFINVSASDSIPHMNLWLGLSLFAKSGRNKRWSDTRTSLRCGALIGEYELDDDPLQDKLMVEPIHVENRFWAQQRSW